MIIKDVEQTKRFHNLKNKFYHMTKLLNSLFFSSNISFLQVMIINLIVMVPYISIMFKYEDHFPSFISQALRTVLINKFSTDLGIDVFIMQSLVLALSALIITLTFVHLYIQSLFTFLSYLLLALMKTFIVFIVPLVDFQISSYQRMIKSDLDFGSRMLTITLVVSLALAISVGLLVEFFWINILRKKNSFWNVQNAVLFNGYLFQIYKSAVISAGYDIFMWCIIGLLIWYHHRQSERGIIGKYQATVEFGLFDLIAATDAAVLISLVTGNRYQAFSFWVVFLIAAVGKVLMAYYHSNNDNLFLPTCDSAPQEFYDFYYRYKERFNGDDQAWNQKTLGKNSRIYHLHKFWCKVKDCQLNTLFRDQDKKNLEVVIGEVLESKKRKNIEARLFYELWNLELGKSIQIKPLLTKQKSCSQDYLLYCLEHLSKDSETSLQASQTSNEIKSKAFYDLLMELANHYTLFYQQLGKNNPITDVLVQEGTKIHQKVNKLKEKYSELLRLKLINFKMAQIYLQFLKKFVGEELIDQYETNRLLSLQKQNYYENINDNAVPTVTFDHVNGNVEDVNAEAQKLLMGTRYQIKTKNIKQFIYPCQSMEQLKELFKNQNDDSPEHKVFSFWKNLEDRYEIGSLTVKKITSKQKILSVLQITREPFLTSKNYFLVTDAFEMSLSLKKKIKIRKYSYSSNPLSLDWADIYSEYIKPKKDEIMKNKMTKLETKHKDCQVVVKQLKSIAPGYRILDVQVHVQEENTQMRTGLRKRQKTSIMHIKRNSKISQKQEFQFNYYQQEQRAVLEGNVGSSKLAEHSQRKRTMSLFEKNIQNHLVSSLFNEEKDLGEGIRTYRLYQGELYNVDLQDKQAYLTQFQAHEIKDNTHVEKRSSYSLQKILVLAVVICCCGLLGLSAVQLIKFGSANAKALETCQKFVNVHQFELDFNRIVALLKDYASGFNTNFPNISLRSQLSQSYNRIQLLKEQQIFLPNSYQIVFQSHTFNGSIVQIVDILLAHVNEMLSSGDLSLVEDIHAGYPALIHTIELQSTSLKNLLDQEFNQLKTFKYIVLYVSSAVILLLFLIMFLFCYSYNEKIKTKLMPLLYIADSQAKQYQESAQNIKIGIEILSKNQEINSESIFSEIKPERPRKKPKEVKLSKEIIVFLVVFSIIGLSIHLTSLFQFSQFLATKLDTFDLMLEQTESLFQVYNGPIELAIEASHGGQIDPNQIGEIKNNMKYLTYQIRNMKFSPDLNSYISTVFMENSCTLMQQKFNLTQAECANTTPQFTITNPFELGLLFYLNRQNYFVYNNMTQMFAHTSTYSNIFVKLYNDILKRIGDQLVTNLNQIQNLNVVLGFVVIFIDVCYLVVFFVFMWYFKKQIMKIQLILQLFKERAKNNTAQQQQKQEEPEQMDVCSDDEESELHQKKKPVTKRTIEYDLQKLQ